MFVGLVVKIDVVDAFQPVAEVQRISFITTVALMLTVVLGWILFLRPLGQRMQKRFRAADRMPAVVSRGAKLLLLLLRALRITGDHLGPD